MSTPPRCERCDAVIDPNEWHPVAVNERDGDIRVLAFCSDRCRENWDRPDEG